MKLNILDKYHGLCGVEDTGLYTWTFAAAFWIESEAIESDCCEFCRLMALVTTKDAFILIYIYIYQDWKKLTNKTQAKQQIWHVCGFTHLKRKLLIKPSLPKS